MATLPTQSSPLMSPVAPSPLSSIKKVFSSKRRSSDVQDALGSPPDQFRRSAASIGLDRSPTGHSTSSSPSRDDGSSISGSSGMKKFFPGQAKRQRRKLREEELNRIAAQEAGRGHAKDNEDNGNFPLPPTNQSSVSLNSSLVTDDSEPETTAPPLVSRDSHAGYLTTSSPLIKSAPIQEDGTASDIASNLTPQIPVIHEPAPTSANVSPHSHPISESTPVLPMPGLTDKADTPRLDSDNLRIKRKSISSSLRGKSPARKIKEVFSAGKSQRSPRTSPDRSFQSTFASSTPELLGQGGSISERRSSKDQEKPDLPYLNTGRPLQHYNTANASFPSLEADRPPQTPPSAALVTPQTTITPPTPTNLQPGEDNGSARRKTEVSQSGDEPPEIVASASGTMISHKRGRSNGSLSQTFGPSKLSNSVTAPLTPTTEEPNSLSDKSRNVTPGGSFFSSWVSAAQNAATQVTNAINNTQNSDHRSGSSTRNSESRSNVAETITEESTQDEEESPKKQLAIETLGSGDLDFTHLGLDAVVDPSELEDSRKDPTVRRDEAAAKIEDMLAKRAVSQAYERVNDQTPMAEVADPMISARHSATFGNMSTMMGNEKTTPNGSIFEGDSGSIKRNNSVRSKITKRRSRGSSIATGHSTIGAALVSASTSTLANPAKGPTLSGFAIAPKQRNRNFHQQFRSVPEDDYLIEDYSCALQKDILHAGRIYISEGHICFSSNILGWVTTLVISFEEVVSIERESTAMVFPNAIAIQTLHARHTFRSLLSREATYDLMIGIWKVSHPAAFKKSANGRALEQETTQELAGALGGSEEKDEESEDDDEEDDDSEGADDEDDAQSFVNSEVSVAGSAPAEMRTVARKPSAMNGAPINASTIPATGESAAAPIATTAAGDTPVDFPGPATHAATDCTDSATHYDRIVKDEIIAAPLGKIYSLLYGPQSGAFVRKYLIEEQKAADLVLEDDKTGLNNDIKSRQYTYIKPLGGSIGPKQTKCITTEHLDFFDLEKSISVTCTTQTPDVPSGSAFSVKTRYCLSWAPGNSTRLQMNCGIEWTAKSWLKGPIEKGANDGQQAYGDGLVKVLKSGLVRPRAVTTGSKSKSGRKKSKKERGERVKEKESAVAKKEENWGLLEPARSLLGPVVDVARPLMNGYVAWSVIVLLLFVLWLRRPALAGDVGFAGGRLSSPAQRFAAYEEMWKKEECDLWDWLEDRIGMDVLSEKSTARKGKQRQAPSKSNAKNRSVEARLREERMSQREMEDAIRVTQERLLVLQKAVEKQKAKREL